MKSARQVAERSLAHLGVIAAFLVIVMVVLTR
jgi:hypothetical protein